MDQMKIWNYFQSDGGENDIFANAMPRYRFIARQISQEMNVLNVGVGTGGLESILIEKCVNVSCMDPSEHAIKRVRDQLELGENARVGYSQSMPFPDNEFDVVVMSEVLEHLSDDILEKTLSEIRRVLKEQGRFIGTVPANENLIDQKTVCPHCGEVFHRWGHLQSYSRKRLGDLLQKNGFMIIRNETRAFPDWRRTNIMGLLKSAVRYVLGRLGSPIASPNLYFEAKA